MISNRLMLWALVAFGAAMIIQLTALGFQTSRANRLQAKVAGYVACEAAVTGKPKAKPVTEVCSPAIASADQVADRARACDAAIGASDLYGLEHSCSTPVKALDARLAAAMADAKGLRDELTLQRKGQAAALREAELRGQLASERKARRDAAVQAAPRDGDGLRVYDAGSVCARWGCPGDARP